MTKMYFAQYEVTLTYHLDSGKFTVVNPLMAEWRGQEMHIVAGFVTDLASVPRRLRGVVSQVGKHIIPAIFHDCAYAGGFGLTRKEADQMFFDGMESVGVPWYRKWAMYGAVRAGGWASWKG